MPQAHALITGDAYLPVSASGANHWSAAVLVFSEKVVPYSVCMSQQLPSISTAADAAARVEVKRNDSWWRLPWRLPFSLCTFHL